MSSTLRVVVRGGLGNQMFQAAYGLSLAERFRGRLSLLDLTHRARVQRTWALSCFGLNPEPLSAWQAQCLLGRIGLAQKLKHRVGPVCLGTHVEVEEFSGPLPLEKLPAVVSGYWQGARYFAEHEDAVRAMFQFPEIAAQHRLWPTADASERVAIHVRRGDYVSDPIARTIHLVCDADWYRQAWARMRERHPGASAWVFSDDADWARRHLQLPGEVHHVPQNPARPVWGDMAHMSQCDHHVISNSSFSWWAAFLGRKPHSQVICPASWFCQVPTARLGMALPDWELL
jgi:Glycosyl transferase family 11